MSDSSGKPGSKGVIEKPPNKLARIVPKEGGKLLSELMHDVDTAVKKLEGAYQQHLEADMNELSTLFNALKEDKTEENSQKLFRLSHNMKGQAGTFGFPLITEVGQSLCHYLTKCEGAKKLKTELVELHVNALRVIYREQITGGGDTVSQQVVAALRETVGNELDRLSKT